MNPLRTAGLLGAGLVALVFCLGLGWGPASSAVAPERLALIVLVAAGLIWPVVLLRFAAIQSRHRPLASVAAQGLIAPIKSTTERV